MNQVNYISIVSQMNFISKLQSEYEQLWKYILRPTRTTYNEEIIGPSLFTIKEKEVLRKDFQLTNKRGYTFACSLWLPVEVEQYPCVIYLHGNSSNRIEGIQYLRRLMVNKIALCTFDFSGCGNAQGQYVSLGYHEQQDLQEVINYLKNYPKINNIALWGRSMGAVTALLFLAINKEPGVKVAVFDSPFKSLKSLVEDMAQKTSKIPKIVLSGALKIIAGTIQQKANFSIYDLNPMKAVSKIYTPAFFIVGVQDEVIPIDHTKDLFEAYAGDEKLIKMVRGKHNDNRPTECIRQVVRFLLHHFKKAAKEASIQENKGSQKQIKGEISSQPIEMQRVEESINKGEFSWSNLFNIFNKGDSKKQKQEKGGQKKQQQDIRKSKLIQKQKSQSVISKPAKQKLLPTGQMQKKLEEDELQDRMRHYTYCYL